jgi:hypothetical protein
VWRAIWQFLDAILLAAWWLGIGRLICQDHLHLSRLSLVLATAAAAGAAANVAGLSVVRDVLLGVLFALWTAWWISLLVYLRANHKQLPQLPRRDRGAASCGLVDGQPVVWRPAVCSIGGGLIMRPRRRSTAESVSSPLRAARARHCPDPRALVGHAHCTERPARAQVPAQALAALILTPDRGCRVDDRRGEPHVVGHRPVRRRRRGLGIRVFLWDSSRARRGEWNAPPGPGCRRSPSFSQALYSRRLGPAVQAVGLWRSRALPRWVPILSLTSCCHSSRRAAGLLERFSGFLSPWRRSPSAIAPGDEQALVPSRGDRAGRSFCGRPLEGRLVGSGCGTPGLWSAIRRRISKWLCLLAEVSQHWRLGR